MIKYDFDKLDFKSDNEKELKKLLDDLFKINNVEFDPDCCINLIKENLSIEFLKDFGLPMSSYVIIKSMLEKHKVYSDFINEIIMKMDENKNKEYHIRIDNNNENDEQFDIYDNDYQININDYNHNMNENNSEIENTNNFNNEMLKNSFKERSMFELPELFKENLYLYNLLENEKYSNSQIEEIISNLLENFDKIEILECDDELKKRIISTCVKEDKFRTTLKNKLENIVFNLLKTLEINNDLIQNQIYENIIIKCDLQEIKNINQICEYDQNLLIDNLSESLEFKNYFKYIFKKTQTLEDDQILEIRENKLKSILLDILKENNVKTSELETISTNLINSKNLLIIEESIFIPKSKKLIINENILNNPELKNIFVNIKEEKLTLDVNHIIHLIKYINDKQNNVLVNKFVIVKEELLKFNKIVSANEVNNNLIKDDLNEGLIINFEEMNKLHIQLMGAFGRKDNLLNFMNKNYSNFDKDLFLKYVQIKGNGIYLIPINNNNSNLKQFLLIIWSNDDSDFDNVNDKKNYISLVRYLTQLCNNNFVILDKKDIDLINFNQDKVSSLNRFKSYNIEKEEIEKEKFELKDGFKIKLDKSKTIDEIKLMNSGFYSKKFIQEIRNIILVIKSIQEKYLFDFLNKNYSKSKFIIESHYDDTDAMKMFIKNFNLEYSNEYNDLELEIDKLIHSIKKEIEDKITPEILNEELETKYLIISLEIFEKFYREEFNNFKDNIEFIPIDNKIPFMNVAITKYKDSKGKNEQFIDHYKKNEIMNFLDSLEKEAILLFIKDKDLKLTQDEEEIILKENDKNIVYELIVNLYNKQKSWLKIFYSINRKSLENKLKEIKTNIKSTNFNKNDENEENIKLFYFILKTVKSYVLRNNIFDEISIRTEKINNYTKNVIVKRSNNLVYNNFKILIDKININKDSKSEVKIVELFYDHKKKEIQLKLEKITIKEAKNYFELFELTPQSEEISKFKQNKNYIIKPKIHNSHNKCFEINSSYEVVKIFKGFRDNIYVICNFQNHSEILHYNLSSNNQYKNNVNIKKLGKKILLADFCESTGELLLYYKEQDEANFVFYKITEGLNLTGNWTKEITTRFNISDVKFICYETNKKSIWIIDGNSQLIKYDTKLDNIVRIKYSFKEVNGIWLVPNSSCLIVLDKREIIPILTDTYKVLNSIDLEMKEIEDFSVCLFSDQIHILLRNSNILTSKVILTTMGKSELQIKTTNDYANNNVEETEIKNNILDYIFYIYDKFPIYSILKPIEEQIIFQNFCFYGEEFVEENTKNKIMDKLKNIEIKLSKTQKPNPGLEILKNSKFYSFEDNLNVSSFFTKEFELGQWIQELICFIPIQIARAENNSFEVLTDGILLPIDDCQNVSDLKTKISLGLYEAILNSWKGEIKVISSMGKQSTGKSYTLNHLSGSSFAISGARCTDGCWLTMKLTKECLYVLLDFEGIGSFERTDQEDMLLSVFNSALSNATLFKTEYRIDREIDNMFKKFNSGGNMLKGSDKIFNGTFIIVIKDVAERDIDSLNEEFREKIQLMMKKEKDKNFINMLYKGGFSIFPFPPLESRDYYDEMEKIKNYINTKLKSVFKDGREFLDTTKLILSKMSFNDFTAINRQEIDLRVKYLNDVLENTINYGQIINPNYGITSNNEDNCLRSLDDISKRIETKNNIKIDCSLETINYEDSEIHLGGNNFNKLIEIFNNSINKTHSNHLQWHKALNQFIEQVIKFRMSRVNKWVEVNIEKWKDYSDCSDLMTNLRNSFLHKKREVELSHKLCKGQCSKCYTLCIRPYDHENEHICSSKSHKCEDYCEYCKQDGILAECKFNFGHEEDHMCKEINHSCGSPCMYSKSNQCEKECSLISGHQGNHKCGTTDHKCKQKCSLNECKSLCELKADFPHTIHKCIKEQCTKKCKISGCKNKCSSHDHFHANPISSVFKNENNIIENDFKNENGQGFDLDIHICGNEHQCKIKCEEKGFCSVITERKIIEEEYEGKKGKFKYNKQYVTNGDKLNCIKTIPPFVLNHEGSHIHSLEESSIHQCETKCPTCENICEKPFGHEGKHTTAHGNMTNYHFISNQTDLDVGDHKYIVGESAKAEMCHIFCQTMGRGHIHIVECDKKKKAKCKYDLVKDKRRHQSCKYGPYEDVPKDEIWHDQYWESINFEDPCAESEKEIYSKCPYYCGSDRHEKNEPIYCEMDLWHKKQSNNSNLGFVSVDGHVYSCNHPASSNGYHFVLALDSSGSMQGQPWIDLVNAVISFVNSRINYTNDRLSIVIYNHSAEILSEFINFTEMDTNLLLNSFKDGGTLFSNAISTSSDLIKKHLTNCPDLNPVFIFMSDGIDSTGATQMMNLYDEFHSKGLLTYVIGFGTQKIEQILQNLANLAQGEYLNSVDSLQLKNSFLTISSVLGAKISVAKSSK